MELTEIFTKKNIEVLRLLSKESLHIRDIAGKLDISPAKVHSTIQLFKKHNLIKENKEKNKIVISLNKESTLLKNIIDLLNANNVDVSFEPKMNIFDTISPLDFRYYGRNERIFQKLQPYLSENAMIRHMAKVEAALTNILAKKGICSKKVADEVEKASKKISAEEVYVEEDKLKHNVRALVNCIRNRVSDEAKPFIHFTATSHDIISTADALRCKEFTNSILIPALIDFEKTLIDLALRERNTLQVGRTHGQHAVPITFGFALAQYVSRFGNSILKIRKSGNNLRGKIAGAVGSYNASSLFFRNPEEFEKQVLQELNLKPSPISTQIPEAEFMVDYVNAVVESFGVLANLSDDMRNLQRSEIAEVGEIFTSKQVGSSTMPQKRNPINFENVKSLWKEFMPRIITLYSDQISEHQRDLTNSASSRFIPEILAAFYISVKRLNRTMKSLNVDEKNLKKNFDMNKGLIVAEPLYILLAAYNHPDAHEAVKQLTLKAQSTKKPLQEIIKKEKSLKQYLKKFNKEQLKIINNPENYVGIANKKTESVCVYWKKELKI
ncbi:MAG: lyase family protein [Candidatus Woesearchaeota archaeon]|jgi:adenylosuccinate lyase|nr:lyase family protein [Candidatus Woesearchaeota archaeon]MDP6265695.1 lyase family protein [Candidatus Woesearchaeota archaeon]MDP7322813.1 lyase family protein [Candidatus Woesearchaeota archaeon]MDP7476696.1 lyase family protein [Candidatus Woesearchaeota archaeon]HJO01730.1 lyase family protein [Candidatus Woesearchaeota archaeon]